MKKKITLFLTLIMSLVAIFAFSAVGAVAEESGFSIKVNDVSVTKGSSVTVDYTLKYDGQEIDYLVLDGEFNGYPYSYAVKPYVEIVDAEGNKLDATTMGVIDTKDMAIGEKTVTIKVYDKQGATTALVEGTFKLNVVKKDNTMTIVMIVLIVLIVGYLIWSNYSAKKKQKKAQSQASELKIGDRVKTIGGVCGFVSEINDAENTFTLEVGANSFVKFDKGAIYQTAPAQGSAVAKEENKEENAEKPEEKKEEK